MRIRDRILEKLEKARSAPRNARAAGAAEIAALRVQRGRSLCKQAQEAYALSSRAAKRRTR